MCSANHGYVRAELPYLYIQAFQPVRHCVHVKPHALRMVKHRRLQIIRMHHELAIEVSLHFELGTIRKAYNRNENRIFQSQ